MTPKRTQSEPQPERELPPQKLRLRPGDEPGITDPVERAKMLEKLADWSTRPNCLNDPQGNRR